jgi:SAM-dependent methyltransferase
MTVLRRRKDTFQDLNAIDFGCADGSFLPTLSRYFGHVAGIDMDPQFVQIAVRVIEVGALGNVRVICNHDLTTAEISSQLGSRPFHVLFLLEVVEHVGNKSDPWNSRVDFVRSLFDLLGEGGIIVVSVPVMTGVRFLLQRFGLTVFGAGREPLSFIDLLKASLLNDTSRLEEGWCHGHLGFNHRKLERQMKRDLRLLARQTTPFQAIYVLQRK